jgi:hypothetical protein
MEHLLDVNHCTEYKCIQISRKMKQVLEFINLNI